jgi:zeaxanthin glucosyltransferase
MKIGFRSLPLTGHLNPMTALARKLQSRGHETVFIGVPDIEPVVRAGELDFVPIDAERCDFSGCAGLARLPVSRA